MKLTTFMLTVLVLLESDALAGGRGLAIQPDKEGNFEYFDDFSTPKFLSDAFVKNIPPGLWTKGSITNAGPNRNRTLTYRFYGDRVITSIEVRVDQTANGINLGANNFLYSSPNGLDWQLAASSSSQKADHNGWQSEPLAVSPELAAKFIGETEVWVRIILDNYCGLKTNTSNVVRSFRVRFTLGAEAKEESDPQSAKREAWSKLRREAGWRSISLDRADVTDGRAPHYYEDADGWLQKPNANPHFSPDESRGFPIRRAYISNERSPLSLATFVRTERAEGALMARINVLAGPDSSRKMDVLWDGRSIASFDVASGIETEKTFFVEIPGSAKQGIHELRISASDSGAILVRRITLAGAGSPNWAERPKLPDGGSLKLLSAYYMPDPLPPADSQAVEGRHAKQKVGLIFRHLQRLYKEHADFGALRLVVCNGGKTPVRIGDMLLLNGKPIEESYVNFVESEWDARGVVWYRVRPKLLQPGECGQIYIRFRRRPEGDHAVVTLPLENGASVEAKIPYTDPGLAIDYLTTGKSMDALYVYVRRSAGAKPSSVSALTLDGKPLKATSIYGVDFPGDIALAVAKLSAPLKAGEYHVVGVTNRAGETVAAQFRVMPFMFLRSSIHIRPDLCKQMHANLAMWHQQSLETCLKYDIYTTSAIGVGGKLFDLHERVAYVLGPDEPDAHDNRGGGYDRGLGFHARRLVHSGWQELIERYAPHAASWIIMNGTTRPLNWSVYGQFADVSCFDPYPINFYGADHAYVRESLLLARRCGVPNRMYACLEAFGWKSGQGVPRGARGPTPAEYRQNVVQAIGAGMKGLTSWVYVGGAGGWEINKSVAEEIAKMNALIEHIEADLLLGTPIDLAASDAGLVATGIVNEEKWLKERVWVGSLLCGPDAILLAAANHIPASKPNPPGIEPAKDVTITVQLPDFLRQVNCFEVTENGVAPYSCTVADGKATLKLDSIESGRVFILRRK